MLDPQNLARARPSLLRTLRVALAALLLAACSDAPTEAPNAPPADPPGPADHLRLTDAWLVGTHNSYWVDRGVATDLFSSGVQESLLDQLLADQVRAIELDVHPDGDRPHRFRVHHTVPGNTLCDDLTDCLRPLRLFHAALPRHEAVHVIVELKRFSGPNFDAEHTVDDLEAILEEALGTWLFRPRDLLAVCDPSGTDPDPDLTACIAEVGWPTLAEMRGRFIVSVLGNFDDLLPQAKGTLDWAQFTLHGELRRRTAFAMASSWKLDWEALPEKIQQELSREDLARARRRAIFLQVEDVADPNLQPLLAANGLVRIDGAFSLDEQRARVALGAQILQSDTPWIQIENRGPAQPLRPLDASEGEIVEPGERLVLRTPDAGGETLAWREVRPASAARWETLPSVGAESDATLCLAAAARAEDPAGTSIAICRTKLRAVRTPGTPLGSGDPDSEKLRLRQRVCRDGQCAWSDLGPADPTVGDVTIGLASLAEQIGIGVAIALQIDPEGSSSCARAFAATDLGPDEQPQWFAVGTATCFATPLGAQGPLALAGVSPGAALFVGPRLTIDGRPAAVRPLDTRDGPL